MKLNRSVVAFTGGGTGGHIYPGLAVADELRNICNQKNKELKIIWIGCSKGMDSKIISTAISSNTLSNTALSSSQNGAQTIADKFYGIPSGKLRRYFSLKNFSDLFRIAGGFFSAFFILKKEKPSVLFSKGGFVSVPPCIAAKILGIPVYTHECDFTLGLANRINFKSAKSMFVSYEETKKSLSSADQNRVIVTGNPVRPVFYNTNAENGLKFLGIDKGSENKPVLLVLGGSSGARQVNNLVFENLEWLCQKFIVVHQTGLVNNNDNKEKELSEKYGDNYKPYAFIYEQMPDVVACADIILSRSGANSIWEAAVLLKPMILIPLCGSGTRGDQVDNARFFAEKGAAEVLIGEDANSEKLKAALENLYQPENRKSYIEALKKMTEGDVPSKKIADIIFKEFEK